MTVDSRYGFTIGNPSHFGPGGHPDEHLYEAQEQVNWVRGARAAYKDRLRFQA